MSEQAISMWHVGDGDEECAAAHSGLLIRLLYDPDMRLVFSGPGGLPYLLRAFVRQFTRLHQVVVPLAERRLAG
ncbi:MAG: hypothetical protein JXR94_20175 [Candidatus Hydrogenedentes bacterium]|nr:hypothetical protein [Candidatus Hydrogenedentota bacterium]